MQNAKIHFKVSLSMNGKAGREMSIFMSTSVAVTVDYVVVDLGCVGWTLVIEVLNGQKL